MPGFKAGVVVLVALTAAAGARAGQWRTGGRAALEARWFFESPAHAGQLDGAQVSLELAPEWRFTSRERRHRIVLAPSLRVDAEDDERTHFDLREAYWLRVGRDWELTLGARRVFWGVTESRHLVDVVSQVDAVEDVDEEDRLGQPMVALSLLRDWGTLDLHVLLGARGRTSPGRRGRLRPPLPVERDRDRWDDVSYAARWSRVLGDVDLGVHLFHGTDREARAVQASEGGHLKARHGRMSQLGVDLQVTKGAWLFKLEALWRDSGGHSFGAATAGFEWTRYGLAGTAADVGLLLELHHDGRDPRRATPTLHDDDLFVGTRLALNDAQDTSLLAGVLFDPETRARLLVVEAERRLGDSFTVKVDVRLFTDGADDLAMAPLALDDHVTVAWAWHF